MALVVADRVKQTAASITGTGTYTLSGTFTGFQTFTEGVGDGNTTYYAAVDGANFEIGIGTYTASGTTLARTTILQSSNSDNAVSWSSATPIIFTTYPADKAVFTDANGDVTIKTSDGAILNLQTSDTDVGNGDILGAINFQAPDESSGGDAIEIAAAIEAEAVLDFKSSKIEGDLVFKVAKNAAATERMRLTHSGALELTSTTNEDNLLIKTTFGSEQGGTPDLKLYNDSTQAGTDNPLGVIKFNANTANHSNHQFADILGMAFSTTQNALEGGVRFRFAEGSDHAWGANEWMNFRPEKIQYYNGSATSTIAFTTPTSNRTLTLPDATGTIALTSDIGSVAADDITAGDAAVTIETTSGNITIDAQGSDTDIIFKCNDNGSPLTALTLDGSDDGTANFSNDIRLDGHIYVDDSKKVYLGTGTEFQMYHLGFPANTWLLNSVGDITIGNSANDKDVVISADDQLNGVGKCDYFRADGSTGQVKLYHVASGTATERFSTSSTGISVTGAVVATTVTTGTVNATSGNIALDAEANDTLVEIKGNNAGGTLQLNCENNSHGVKLQSPDHSAAQSYTLKLPDNQVAANKILKVKSITGSGATAVGQLEFADESGGGGSTAADDITAGDAAVTIATTTGDITIDAQGSDTDIIFKGTDDTTDITALTLDMSNAGKATFNDDIQVNKDVFLESVGTGTKPLLDFYWKKLSTTQSIGQIKFNAYRTPGIGRTFATIDAYSPNNTNGSELGSLKFGLTIGNTTSTRAELTATSASGGIFRLQEGFDLSFRGQSGSAGYTTLTVTNPTQNNTITLPDATGTVALTSDLGGGGGVTVQDEGSALSTAGTTLNFVGAGVVASGTGATKTITIAGGGSGITVQDEGSALSTAGTTLNFVGAGVTASGTGATKTITISGGGGGGGITTGKAIAMAMVFG